MNRRPTVRGATFVLFAAMMVATAGAAATSLERGAYLMSSIVACGNCHTPQGPEGRLPGMELAGGLVIEDVAFTVVVPNITPDPETGIGNWTDEQIIAAIREGRRPDGSIIGPPMPIELYRGISDDDVQALVAYMRQVPAVQNQVAPNQYDFPLPANYGPPVGSVAQVPRDDPVVYGAYLAGPLGHCVECHTPMVEGRRDFEHQLNAGGVAFIGPWGVSVSRNITPHRESGIGAWSDDDIERAIRTGVRPDGEHLLPPMGYHYYANLSGRDLSALIAYLRWLEPIETEPR